MKTYTITKAQLLRIYQEGTNALDLEEGYKLPTYDLNIRIPKSEILLHLQSVQDHKGWLEIVPAKRSSNKVIKLDQAQFATLIAGLLAKTENFKRNISRCSDYENKNPND